MQQKKQNIFSKLYGYFKSAKTIVKIAIVIVVFFILYQLLSSIAGWPSIGSWFRNKPLQIESTEVVVERVKDLAELITIVTYDEVIVDSTKISTAPFGKAILNRLTLRPNTVEDRIIQIVKGKALLGINLKLIAKTDISISKDSVSMAIPMAEILSIIVNPSDKEIFEEKGNWTSNDSKQLQAIATQKIKVRILQQDLLNTATEKAKMFFAGFLQQLGYKKVHIYLKSNN
jgi:hypothetical protein